MTNPQNRRTTGRNCRTRSATIANPHSLVGARRPATLFSQFPPRALFRVMGRAVLRQAAGRQFASGMRVANCALWHAQGGS
jgi:hypothetical protein